MSLPLDCSSRVRISAPGLPTVWSEGRHITLKHCLRPWWAVKIILQSKHPTFQSQERLVKFERGRGCFVGLSICIVSLWYISNLQSEVLHSRILSWQTPRKHISFPYLDWLHLNIYSSTYCTLEMGACSRFHIPALPRSRHFRNGARGNTNFIQERGNKEHERIGTLNSRSCAERQDIMLPPPKYTQ